MPIVFFVKSFVLELNFEVRLNISCIFLMENQKNTNIYEMVCLRQEYI